MGLFHSRAAALAWCHFLLRPSSGEHALGVMEASGLPSPSHSIQNGSDEADKISLVLQQQAGSDFGPVVHSLQSFYRMEIKRTATCSNRGS